MKEAKINKPPAPYSAAVCLNVSPSPTGTDTHTDTHTHTHTHRHPLPPHVISVSTTGFSAAEFKMASPKGDS